MRTEEQKARRRETLRKWRARMTPEQADKRRSYMRAWKSRPDIMQRRRERDRAARWALKLEVVAAYGGRCECCGETSPEFLSIDHAYGGGRKHRASLRKSGLDGGGGNPMYQALKKAGWPRDGYRLLCFNCNCSRGFYGYCPHEKRG